MQVMPRVCLLSVLGVASGCNLYFSDSDPQSHAEQPTERPLRVVADIRSAPIRDLDLLFVIDDSGSMREEQVSLAAWSEDSLFGVLKTQSEDEFNLHVGVVSTDVGAGPYGIMGCEQGGDNGRLQGSPTTAGCSAPMGSYIRDVAGPDGSRIANHEGSVSEAFACIAQLGTAGCGFEQPLESMKRALDGTNADNAGFLRDDALLAVVIVSDEDDCSAANEAVFDSAPGREDFLGPLASFRCFEYGVICDGDDPHAPGTKTGCRVREDSEYMASIAEYSDFLKGLKVDPSLVLVAGITGPTGPVVVGLDDYDRDYESRLENACEQGISSATPATRLREFFASFPARNTVASICNESLERPLSQVAHRIRETANQTPCLFGEIFDEDPDMLGLQPDCEVQTLLGDVVSEIASCEGGGDQPCYRIEEDAETCPNTRSGLSVQVEQAPPPVPGAHLVVRCR